MVSVETRLRSSLAGHSSASTGLVINKDRHEMIRPKPSVLKI